MSAFEEMEARTSPESQEERIGSGESGGREFVDRLCLGTHILSFFSGPAWDGRRTVKARARATERERERRCFGTASNEQCE
jgi:hypothetical protein